MKEKRVSLVIYIVIFIIGIIVGVIIKNGIANNDYAKGAERSEKNERIRNSSYSNEKINKALDELDSLYEEKSKIITRKMEIEARITELESQVNAATDFTFEPQDNVDEIDNQEENIESENAETAVNEEEKTPENE